MSEQSASWAFHLSESRYIVAVYFNFGGGSRGMSLFWDISLSILSNASSSLITYCWLPLTPPFPIVLLSNIYRFEYSWDLLVTRRRIVWKKLVDFETMHMSILAALIFHANHSTLTFDSHLCQNAMRESRIFDCSAGSLRWLWQPRFHPSHFKKKTCVKYTTE